MMSNAKLTFAPDGQDRSSSRIVVQPKMVYMTMKFAFPHRPSRYLGFLAMALTLIGHTATPASAATTSAPESSQAVLAHIELTSECLPARPADNANVSGLTVMFATVSASGFLGTAVVEQSSGSSDLDSAASESVKRCKVRPGHDKWGRPLESTVLIAVSWKGEGPGEAAAVPAVNFASNPECQPSYPFRPKPDGAQGTTMIAMQVEQDGSLSAVAVAQSSGPTREHRILDGYALKAVALCGLQPRAFTDNHPSGPALTFVAQKWLLLP